jgi:dTMP kinase
VQSDEGLLGDPAGNQPMKPEVETVIEPHLTVWFDLPPEAAALRLAGARLADRFESQPLAFFQRVAQGYADRQQGHPERFARINAAQDRETVWQDVLQVFVEKGWLEGAALS